MAENRQIKKMNRLSNFGDFALTRTEMKNIVGATNYDCYCKNSDGSLKLSGSFGAVANTFKDHLIMLKNAAQNCQNQATGTSSFSCSAV